MVMCCLNKTVVNTMEHEVVLNTCFECFAQNGLEYATIRNASRATGLTASSIYYRFKDKDQLIVESTYYGHKSITQGIFIIAINHLDNIQEMIEAIIEEIDGQKDKIRFIYQVASSPQHGDRLKELSNDLSKIYVKFSSIVADKWNISAELVLPYISLSIASVRQYIVWGNREMLKTDLNFLYSKLTNSVNGI